MNKTLKNLCWLLQHFCNDSVNTQYINEYSNRAWLNYTVPIPSLNPYNDRTTRKKHSRSRNRRQRRSWQKTKTCSKTRSKNWPRDWFVLQSICRGLPKILNSCQEDIKKMSDEDNGCSSRVSRQCDISKCIFCCKLHSYLLMFKLFNNWKVAKLCAFSPATITIILLRKGGSKHQNAYKFYHSFDKGCSIAW